MKSWKINYETDQRDVKKFLLRPAKTKEEARLKGEDYLHILMRLGEIKEYKITSIEPDDQPPMRTQ
jgi:hypothetical protein